MAERHSRAFRTHSRRSVPYGGARRSQSHRGRARGRRSGLVGRARSCPRGGINALIVGSNAVDVVEAMAPPAVSAMYGRDTDAVYGPPISQWSTDAEFRCPAQQVASWHTQIAP